MLVFLFSHFFKVVPLKSENVCCFPDKPSPPENVHAEEIEGESLTLYWYPPQDDGGAEITNYVVEKKEVGTLTWVRAATFVTTTACRVKNLIVGKQYDFQVMAENQYGTSDPGRTREPILAKLPFGKFRK